MLYDADPTHFLMLLILGLSLAARRKTELSQLWSFDPYEISFKGEYYRFLSAPLVHRSALILAINLLILFIFGSSIHETFLRVFSKKASFLYLLLFFSASIIGLIPPFLGKKTIKGFTCSSCGSGITAILTACLFLNPKLTFHLYGFECPVVVTYAIAISYMVFSHFKTQKTRDRFVSISLGLLSGLLFCVILFPNSLVLFFQQIYPIIF